MDICRRFAFITILCIAIVAIDFEDQQELWYIPEEPSNQFYTDAHLVQKIVVPPTVVESKPKGILKVGVVEPIEPIMDISPEMKEAFDEVRVRTQLGRVIADFYKRRRQPSFQDLTELKIISERYISLCEKYLNSKYQISPCKPMMLKDARYLVVSTYTTTFFYTTKQPPLAFKPRNIFYNHR